MFILAAPIWSNKLSTASGMPHSKAESLLFGLATLSKDKGGIVVRDFEGIYLVDGNPPIPDLCLGSRRLMGENGTTEIESKDHILIVALYPFLWL